MLPVDQHHGIYGLSLVFAVPLVYRIWVVVSSCMYVQWIGPIESIGILGDAFHLVYWTMERELQNFSDVVGK